MMPTLRCANVVAWLRQTLTLRYQHAFEPHICYARAFYLSSVARDHGKEDNNKDTSQTPIVSRIEQWSTMCEKLRMFVKKNGHALVPILYPSLGRWVDTQRGLYQLRLQGEHTSLTKERLDILNGLGMVWDAHEYVWEEHYEELLDFYYREGHVNVPQDYQGGLGKWLCYQRMQFRSRQMGESNHTMTTERMVQLSALGMVWDIYAALWEESYQQLAEFSKERGHANVPASAEDTSLSVWVQTQRREYKKYKEGTHAKITPERIERLNKLGFVWDYQEAVWKEHYQELCRYRAEHGDWYDQVDHVCASKCLVFFSHISVLLF
jgi:Helicase associated domain